MRELLADLSHRIWASWMKYQFSKCVINIDGSLTIPASLVDRWTRQFNTFYIYLSEGEKESDREQADKIINLLNEYSVDI